jgi:hypothetical protein
MILKAGHWTSRQILYVFVVSGLAGAALAGVSHSEAAGRTVPTFAGGDGIVLAQGRPERDKKTEPKAKPSPKATAPSRDREMQCGGPGLPSCTPDVPQIVRCGGPGLPDCPWNR